MIAAYRVWQHTLADLAHDFRAHRWPPEPSSHPPGLVAAELASDDPEPYVPDSFDDVVLAYDLGQLTDSDYQTLAAAAACFESPQMFRAPRPNWGAKRGASECRRQATPGAVRRLSSKVTAILSDVKHRLATPWKCLLSSRSRVRVAVGALRVSAGTSVGALRSRAS
jgi:hypothetical protein